jgi:hypothetical protein
MGMLSDGASWLADALMETASEPVTYTRGAAAITVDAVIGGRRRREEQQPQGRVVLVGEPMEFQFDPAALVVPAGGSAITPGRGDRITWGGRVYEVKPHEGEDVQGPSDPFGNLITVQTVRVS